MIHPLKTWSIYFEEIIAGKKPFEIRDRNRPFKEGDFLLLQETDYNRVHTVYTGRSCMVQVLRLYMGLPGLAETYCIMVIGPAFNICADAREGVQKALELADF